MQVQPEQATCLSNSLINELLLQVDNEIKGKKLQEYIPFQNTNFVREFALETAYSYTRHHPKQPINCICEDQMPNSILKEVFLDKRIQIQIKSNADHQVIYKGQTSTQINSFNIKGKNTSQGNRHKDTSQSNIHKKASQGGKIAKQFIKLDAKNKEDLKGISRATSRINQEELEELEIQDLRKTFIRQLSERKESQKIKLIDKKPQKRLLKQFTYDFEGKLLENRRYGRKFSSIKEINGKQSIQSKICNKTASNFNNNKSETDSNLEENLNRTTTGLRNKRIFDNLNQRQVSHLPFIQLNQNMRIIENNKIVEGLESQRSSLKEFQLNNKFKSYTSQKQNQPEVKSSTATIIESNQKKLKQSKTMEEYLRKITKKEEKPEIKTGNFNRVNVARQHCIDQYYKFNFNEVVKL